MSRATKSRAFATALEAVADLTGEPCDHCGEPLHRAEDESRPGVRCEGIGYDCPNGCWCCANCGESFRRNEVCGACLRKIQGMSNRAAEAGQLH